MEREPASGVCASAFSSSFRANKERENVKLSIRWGPGLIAICVDVQAGNTTFSNSNERKVSQSKMATALSSASKIFPTDLFPSKHLKALFCCTYKHHRWVIFVFRHIWAINRLSRYTKNSTAFLPISTTREKVFSSFVGKMGRQQRTQAKTQLSGLASADSTALMSLFLCRLAVCDRGTVWLATHAHCCLLLKIIRRKIRKEGKTGNYIAGTHSRKPCVHMRNASQKVSLKEEKKKLKKMFLVGRSRSNFYTFGRKCRVIQLFNAGKLWIVLESVSKVISNRCIVKKVVEKSTAFGKYSKNVIWPVTAPFRSVLKRISPGEARLRAAGREISTESRPNSVKKAKRFQALRKEKKINSIFPKHQPHTSQGRNVYNTTHTARFIYCAKFLLVFSFFRSF